MLWLALTAVLCQGFFCEEDPGRMPGLPGVRLSDIHLQVLDPASGTPGVHLSWAHPAGEKVTYYEVYQGFRADSLGAPVLPQVNPDPPSALLPLPDSIRPFTIHYGVRAVHVEPTGQKTYGDTLLTDSLTVSLNPAIAKPAAGEYLAERQIEVEARTKSDAGVVLRQSLFEKSGRIWITRLDTCLPRSACDIPFFGTATQNDTLVMESAPPGDTLVSVLCIQGTESHEGQKTGQIQSLICSRFFRVSP